MAERCGRFIKSYQAPSGIQYQLRLVCHMSIRQGYAITAIHARMALPIPDYEFDIVMTSKFGMDDSEHTLSHQYRQ